MLAWHGCSLSLERGSAHLGQPRRHLGTPVPVLPLACCQGCWHGCRHLTTLQPAPAMCQKTRAGSWPESSPFISVESSFCSQE